MLLRKVLAALAVFAVTSIGQAQTQEQPDTKEEGISAGGEANTIVISGTRSREKESKLPQSITTATSAQIRDREPLLPIDALRDQPGVFVQKTGQGGGTPIVRGLMGNRVLYLIDGIRINNGATYAGPNPYFNQVDLGAVDQIEILKGPGSVQYGSDAIGGVVNTRTKTLDLFPEKAEYGGMVSEHFSTADHGKYGHTEVYGASDRVNVLMGLTYAGSSDYKGGGTEGVLQNTSFDSYGLLGKVQYKIDGGHVLTLGYLEDTQTNVTRYDQSARNPLSGAPRFFTPSADRKIVYLRDMIKNQGGLITQIEPYLYGQQFVTYSDVNSESTTAITKTQTYQNQTAGGGGVQAVTPAFNQSLKIVYGIDNRQEVLHNDKKAYAKGTTTPFATTLSQPTGNTPDGTYDVNDVFTMLDWSPADSLRFTAGMRYETSQLKSKPDALDVSSGFTVDDLRINKTWDAVTWGVGGIYWPVPGFGLATEVSTGYRAPTFSDALSFGPFTQGVNTPSPGISPEQSLTWEVGPRVETSDVSLRVAWYRTWLRDLIGGQPTGGYVDLNSNGKQDPGEAAYQNHNSGKAWLNGVDSSVEWRFQKYSRLFGTFNWTDGRDESANAPLSQLPPTFGTLGARYRYSPQTFWVEAFTRVVAEQKKINPTFYTDPAEATHPAQTYPATDNPPLRRDYSLPGYTTYHVRAGIPMGDKATIFMAGDNLANIRYRETWSRQDSPGISLTIGSEARF